MDDIEEIATNLTQNEEGLWVSRDRRVVSYPEGGNESYFAVEERSFWFKHRNNVIASLVRTFSPGGTVFDIGGGNGFVSMALQENGIDAVVVEPGLQGARNALKRGLRTVIHSSLEDAGFRNESIAAFGLFDVLEHIESDLEFLRTLHRCLQPDGLLYLTAPHTMHYGRLTMNMRGTTAVTQHARCPRP
jgi:2-polyprenyl-3-methyl-5-hydroxy-6-metoxy-1,4-benzoquinol methylase